MKLDDNLKDLLPKNDFYTKEKNLLLALQCFKDFVKVLDISPMGLQSNIRIQELVKYRRIYTHICTMRYTADTESIAKVINKNRTSIISQRVVIRKFQDELELANKIWLKMKANKNE